MLTERVVAQDNTVAIKERAWQIVKTRFRKSLAGSARRQWLLFPPREKQGPSPKPAKMRPKGGIALFYNADSSLIIKTRQLTC